MDLKDYRAQLDTNRYTYSRPVQAAYGDRPPCGGLQKGDQYARMASGREREILYRVTGLCGQELEEYTKILYSTILELSRGLPGGPALHR